MQAEKGIGEPRRLWSNRFRTFHNRVFVWLQNVGAKRLWHTESDGKRRSTSLPEYTIDYKKMRIPVQRFQKLDYLIICLILDFTPPAIIYYPINTALIRRPLVDVDFHRPTLVTLIYHESYWRAKYHTLRNKLLTAKQSFSQLPSSRIACSTIIFLY